MRAVIDADLAVLLTLLAVTIVLFAINRPRMDAVALIMLTLLPLTGVITVEEALMGLSDPNIVLIAALFVLGEGLVRTGVAQKLGDLLARRAGKSESRLIILLMVIVAGIGSVMSSTGVVAIFIPAVLRIVRNAQIPAGRLMMPLSVAALISGMMTLIGTPPNLVVHSQLLRAGFEGFHFFEFTLFGVPVLAASISYMLLTRRWLVPSTDEEVTNRKGARSRPRLSQWIEEYGLVGRVHRLRVRRASPWVGKRLEELKLRSTLGMNVLAIGRRRRWATAVVEPSQQTVVQEHDVLFVDMGEATTEVDAVCEEYGLFKLPITGSDYFADTSQAVGMVEIMIPATSELIGKTAITSRFRSTYKLSVVGIKRGPTPITEGVQDEPFRLGDTLLVAGPWRAITRLRSDPNELVVLNLPADVDDVIALPARAPLAVFTLAVVVALMVSGVVPNVQAALIGCLLLGLFRCVDMNATYRAIHWPTLFLIVGMLPFSTGLQKTGGIEMASQALLSVIGDANPTVMLAGLYAVTVLLGLFISNTATAVLMAPVAITLAAELGMPPHPFAITVALASSAAFITPVSSPVNALVVGPGNYRFMDFVRIGLPLSFVVAAVNIVLVRLIFF